MYETRQAIDILREVALWTVLNPLTFKIIVKSVDCLMICGRDCQLVIVVGQIITSGIMLLLLDWLLVLG